MKQLNFITILMGALLLMSCNKWLDVKPDAQSTKDEIFKTQKGFRDALTGAYIHMKSSNTYGGGLMWGTVEYLAKNWDPLSANNTTLTNLVNGNYADGGVQTSLENIYGGAYVIIADVNSILERIDAQKDIFTDNNYELIKGEALAIRAYAHFDLLRMFGPMPDNPGTSPVLPYMKTVSNNIIYPVAYEAFVQQLLADLNEAEALMENFDPFIQFSRAELNPSANNLSTPNVVADNFYMYRQVRLNYFAVLALKARVYNWLAPLENSYRMNAVKYAQMVIDAKDRNGVPTFRLGVASDRVQEDYTMSSEHIAALSVHNLLDLEKNTLGDAGTLAKSEFNIQDGFYYLNSLFPIAERTSDVRWTGMWSFKTRAGQTGFVAYKKYQQKEQSPILQVPLLRLSEMYLILTETAQDKSTAENFYAQYCAAKGIPFLNGFDPNNWEADRRNKMIREYVREFYAEGQSFFTFKRYNVTTLPAGWTASYYNATTARYLVPKPDREINYNNK